MLDERTSGSVTQWYEQVRQGDTEAAQKIFDRYFQDLTRVALARSHYDNRPGLDAFSEGAAIEALADIFVGVLNGRFAEVQDRKALWKLLLTIAVRKIHSQVAYSLRKKRNANQTVSLDASNSNGSSCGVADQIASPEPDPLTSRILAEEYERLLDALDDDQLRLIAVYRMDGYTVDQIAERLGCSVRLIFLRLKIIRSKWRRQKREILGEYGYDVEDSAEPAA